MTKNEFMETVKDATLAILREKDETTIAAHTGGIIQRRTCRLR